MMFHRARQTGGSVEEILRGQVRLKPRLQEADGAMTPDVGDRRD